MQRRISPGVRRQSLAQQLPQMDALNLVRTYGKNRLAKNTVFEPQRWELLRTIDLSNTKATKHRIYNSYRKPVFFQAESVGGGAKRRNRRRKNAK